MPIPFSCPHCGKRTVVADQYAGQVGPCVDCGQEITIPTVAPKSDAGGARQWGLPVVLGLACLALGVLLIGVVSIVAIAQPQQRKSRSRNNLRAIGLAMHNYHSVHNCFPPAYIANADGSPRTSWRILILPYVNHRALHNKYDFNVDWDDQANIAVRTSQIPLYVSPNAVIKSPVYTNYFVIRGPGTAFDADKSSSISQFTDGTANSLLVVEAFNQGIEWSEPRDLTINQLANLARTGALGRSVLMLKGDGSVQQLPLSDIETLENLAKISNGK